MNSYQYSKIQLYPDLAWLLIAFNLTALYFKGAVMVSWWWVAAAIVIDAVLSNIMIRFVEAMNEVKK